MAQILVKLDDDVLTHKVYNSSIDSVNDNRFMMIFYIKCRHIFKFDQPLALINNSIEEAIEQIE